MSTSWSTPTIWVAIFLIGLCTYLIRLSFIYLFGRLDQVPTRIQRALRFVPAAVLAALVFPAVITVQPSATATLTDDRLLAGAIAAAVAWRTEDVLATIVVGMGSLWAIRFLL
ncbi:AzlD domain-containing protein [Haloferacaceae archaeon DSL9]